jgi:hypothetical protein
MILPERVFGSTSMKSISRGTPTVPSAWLLRYPGVPIPEYGASHRRIVNPI